MKLVNVSMSTVKHFPSLAGVVQKKHLPRAPLDGESLVEVHRPTAKDGAGDGYVRLAKGDVFRRADTTLIVRAVGAPYLFGVRQSPLHGQMVIASEPTEKEAQGVDALLREERAEGARIMDRMQLR